jgi:hypothetical protein
MNMDSMYHKLIIYLKYDTNPYVYAQNHSKNLRIEVPRRGLEPPRVIKLTGS